MCCHVGDVDTYYQELGNHDGCKQKHLADYVLKSPLQGEGHHLEGAPLEVVMKKLIHHTGFTKLSKLCLWFQVFFEKWNEHRGICNDTKRLPWP